MDKVRSDLFAFVSCVIRNEEMSYQQNKNASCSKCSYDCPTYYRRFHPNLCYKCEQQFICNNLHIGNGDIQQFKSFQRKSFI